MAYKFVPYAPEGSGGKDPILGELVVTENGVYDEPMIGGAPEPITWDGVVEDRVTVSWEGLMFVKVSDQVFTKDELGGCTLTMSDGRTMVVPSEQIVDSSYAIAFPFGLVASVYDAPASEEGFTENGTYFLYNSTSDSHIASLTFAGDPPTPADGWNKVTVNVAGDIVDVIELPTENVDPDKIYRVTERSPEHIEVYIASGGQSYTLAGFYQFLNDYVGDGQMNGNGILPTILYEAVDTVPAIEDIPAEYPFPRVANYTETWTGKCFILKSTGEPYVGVQGEGVLSVPSMISDSFGLPVEFTGFIDSLENIPSGNVVATVYVPGGSSIAYGIPDEANNKTVYEHTSAGGWVAVNNDIVDVSELPTEGIEQDKVYRVVREGESTAQLIVNDGAGTVGEYAEIMGAMAPFPVQLKYIVVDSLPSEDDAEYGRVDMVNEIYGMVLYVLADSGQMYSAAESTDGSRTISPVENGIGLEFKGIINDVSEATEAGCYTILELAEPSTIYGIPNNATVQRLVDGVWTDLS